MNAYTIEKTMLERVGQHEKNAFGECLNIYGNYVWNAVKQFTSSEIEAETATAEIFNEIWNYSNRFNPSDSSENKFITLITYHYLSIRFGKNKVLKYDNNSTGRKELDKSFV